MKLIITLTGLKNILKIEINYNLKINFKQINIKNLDIYYDDKMILPKKLMLRGVPTSIIVNKKGEEVARIIGSANFDDKKFINWLRKYN